MSRSVDTVSALTTLVASAGGEPLVRVSLDGSSAVLIITGAFTISCCWHLNGPNFDRQMFLSLKYLAVAVRAFIIYLLLSGLISLDTIDVHDYRFLED